MPWKYVGGGIAMRTVNLPLSVRCSIFNAGNAFGGPSVLVSIDVPSPVSEAAIVAIFEVAIRRPAGQVRSTIVSMLGIC